MNSNNPNEIGVRLTLTRPALEALIGNDEQMTLILKGACVEEVTKRHMGVVERHVKDAIQTALDGGLGSVQHVYDSGKYVDKFILNTDVHNHIYKQLQSLAETAVHNYFTNNRADMMELVGKVVDKQMEYHITNEVNRRMKNAVVELQKKLGA
jgi:hypothetical protein